METSAPHRPVTAEQIDSLLPQTQCTRCGYQGCRPYAEAIAKGDADINQCPPGGRATIEALARLLDVSPKPLNPHNGVEQSFPTVAFIDEDVCIGCALCLKACPVDAIVGAAQQMHTILPEECSGCELCIAPCPVDCISMEPRPAAVHTPTEMADRWRRLFDARKDRLHREEAQRDEARRRKKETLATGADAVAAAIARARAKAT